jgi:hypothetical protein
MYCVYKFNENGPFSGTEGPKLISWSDTRGDWGGGQMPPRLYVKQDAGSVVHGGQLKMKTCIYASSVAQQLNIVLN